MNRERQYTQEQFAKVRNALKKANHDGIVQNLAIMLKISERVVKLIISDVQGGRQ